MRLSVCLAVATSSLTVRDASSFVSPKLSPRPAAFALRSSPKLGRRNASPLRMSADSDESDKTKIVVIG
eukprot:CAMPEP_0113587710 /NCGR_PEP_ID=MMETSP0015_2-20120614/35068_1 /TAXON_ID=2838 /ORGANISM="Odontella" /LENGTH=68 /DNA_ID=CAMNT_0000493417 /DNA_START=23 /DNA_END=225 /DNA_ORIENTATION=+ /assembly_acc=CAM_ASM_000160